MSDTTTNTRTMPNVAVVRRSELGDRWDAPFHIARSHFKGRVDELRATISDEEAIRRLQALPPRAREPMHILARSSTSSIGPASSAQITAAVKAYPHLALALVEDGMQDVARKIREEIEAKRLTLETVLSLTAPSEIPVHPGGQITEVQADEKVTREGVAYPLRESDRFDDDFGIGYDHVMVPAGEGDGEYYLRDMWVVNGAGELHPGYGSNPVPIRLDDIVVSAGVEVEVDLPKPKSMFDSPLFR